MIDEMLGPFEQKNGNKYLILVDVDQSKEASKNMKKFGTELKRN